MPTGNVSFRFYAQLNDFLPAARRQVRFSHTLALPASLKDTIEALGVPHPEVDLLVVNGTPQEFSYGLVPGDFVSVYPAFHSLDLAGLPRLRPAPPQPVRFALDIHLGKLARLLRLAGFDAVIVSDDADLAARAGREERVALTRDVGLLKRSVIRYGYWVRGTDPEVQLSEVLARFDLADRVEPFVRCIRCNAKLEPVDARVVAGRLPPRVHAAFDTYQRCPGCDRIYWQGSHYERLRQLLQRSLAPARVARGQPGSRP